MLWVSMGEKSIKKKSFFKNYQINNNDDANLQKKIPSLCIVYLHTEGEEVSNSVIDGQSICCVAASRKQNVCSASNFKLYF